METSPSLLFLMATLHIALRPSMLMTEFGQLGILAERTLLCC
jgi:hypothetical protein